MNNVKPIKDKASVDNMIEDLKIKHPKYELLFKLGLETGLRVSDLLRIRVSDIDPQIFTIKEKKTGKTKNIRLQNETKKYIKDYVRFFALAKTDFLIYSTDYCHEKPLSRSQAYRVIKKTSVHLELDGIGTHSMRKTYAVNEYKKHGDIVKVSKALNHKHVTTTLAYLITPNDLQKLFN